MYYVLIGKNDNLQQNLVVFFVKFIKKTQKLIRRKILKLKSNRNYSKTLIKSIRYIVKFLRT